MSAKIYIIIILSYAWCKDIYFEQTECIIAAFSVTTTVMVGCLHIPIVNIVDSSFGHFVPVYVGFFPHK